MSIFIAFICNKNSAVSSATESLLLIRQMYKVFINDKAVFFCRENDIPANVANSMVVKTPSQEEMKGSFLEFTDVSLHDSLIFTCKKNVEHLFAKFISHFRYLEAAGGVVRNVKNERLFIFRFQKWDLPKGKLEKAETPELAAIREVTEETGLSCPEILAELPSTYHIYEHKGKLVLKKTFWYAMRYSGNEHPIPQTEEKITEARWIRPKEYELITGNTYTSLHDLIEADLQYKLPEVV